MRMRVLVLMAWLIVATCTGGSYAAQIQGDGDGNGALDISRGGTNAATAAAARTSLGLGNVDNTSDSNKPVSAAGQAALDLKLDDSQLGVTVQGYDAETTILGQTIEESELLFSDITTGNASLSGHGLLPKLSNSTGDLLDGTGLWKSIATIMAAPGNIGGTTPGAGKFTGLQVTDFIADGYILQMNANGYLTPTDPASIFSAVLPTQTGHSGEFLTTDGLNASWGTLDPDLVDIAGLSCGLLQTLIYGPTGWDCYDWPVPSTGNEGDVFVIGATGVEWVSPTDFGLPSQATHSGKFLTTNGTISSWALALPDQTAQDGKFLTTAAGVASWGTPPGSGDVTAVGDCTSGDCLDGTSDGGTLIKLYGPGGFWTSLQAGNAPANVNWRLPLANPAGNSLVTSDSSGNMGTIAQTTYEPANANIQSHITSTANPHTVTAAQVLPDQTGHAGEHLTTDGATVSWGSVMGTGNVIGPADSTAGKVPYWDAAEKTLVDGLTVATTVGDPGADTALVTEQGIREAIAAAVLAAGTGDTIAPVTHADNYIPQWNGVDSKTLKAGLSLATTIGTPGVDTAVASEKAVRDVITATTQSDLVYVRNYSDNLSTAITAIGSSNKVLVVDKNITLTATASTPSTLKLLVTMGGSITLGAYNLTINGPFECGQHQAFIYNSTGRVSFIEGSIQSVNTAWFGTKGNNIQAEQTYLAYAVESVKETGVTFNHYPIPIDIPPGKYYLSDMWTIPAQARIRGAKVAWAAYDVAESGTIFVIDNHTRTFNMSATACIKMSRDTDVRDITIFMEQDEDNAGLLLADIIQYPLALYSEEYTTIRDVAIIQAWDGLRLDGGGQMVSNIHISQFNKGVIFNGYGEQIHMVSCYIGFPMVESTRLRYVMQYRDDPLTGTVGDFLNTTNTNAYIVKSPYISWDNCYFMTDIAYNVRTVFYEGTATSSGSTTVLTDAAATWIAGEFLTDDAQTTLRIWNRTDNAYATITSNTGTTVTHTALSAGQWNIGDKYQIITSAQMEFSSCHFESRSMDLRNAHVTMASCSFAGALNGDINISGGTLIMNACQGGNWTSRILVDTDNTGTNLIVSGTKLTRVADNTIISVVNNGASAVPSGYFYVSLTDNIWLDAGTYTTPHVYLESSVPAYLITKIMNNFHKHDTATPTYQINNDMYGQAFFNDVSRAGGEAAAWSLPASHPNFVKRDIENSFLKNGEDLAGLPIYGSTRASGYLHINGTSNATKGAVALNPTGGNVSVGHTTPQYLLDIGGNARISSTNKMYFGGATSAAGEAYVYYDGTNFYTSKPVSIAGSLALKASDVGSTVASYSDSRFVTNGSSHDHSGGDGAQIDHGGMLGLTDDDHSQYVLLAGRAAGQNLRGSTSAAGTLILDSTSNATKGNIYINKDGGSVGIGGGSAVQYTLDVTGNIRITGTSRLYFGGTSSTAGTESIFHNGTSMVVSDDLILADSTGSGNAYACLDSTGKLYRSATACVP